MYKNEMVEEQVFRLRIVIASAYNIKEIIIATTRTDNTINKKDMLVIVITDLLLLYVIIETMVMFVGKFI